MKIRPSKKSGFSLIEVALALLVVSIGLVATVGMLPGGLENSKKASDDTQSALFADYVLNSLRALSSVSNAAVTRWSDIGDTKPKIPIAAPDMWDQGTTLTINPGTGKQNISFRPAANKDIEELAFAYDLVIQDLNATTKRATLNIWIPSKLNTNSPQTYYADLYRGDLAP